MNQACDLETKMAVIRNAERQQQGVLTRLGLPGERQRWEAGGPGAHAGRWGLLLQQLGLPVHKHHLPPQIGAHLCQHQFKGGLMGMGRGKAYLQGG